MRLKRPNLLPLLAGAALLVACGDNPTQPVQSDESMLAQARSVSQTDRQAFLASLEELDLGQCRLDYRKRGGSLKTRTIGLKGDAVGSSDSSRLFAFRVRDSSGNLRYRTICRILSGETSIDWMMATVYRVPGDRSAKWTPIAGNSFVITGLNVRDLLARSCDTGPDGAQSGTDQACEIDGIDVTTSDPNWPTEEDLNPPYDAGGQGSGGGGGWSGPPSGVPLDVYERMTAVERAMCWENVTECVLVAIAVKEAGDKSRAAAEADPERWGGGEANSPMDAYRHAYWSARMTLGLGEEKAKAWGDAHEVGSDSSAETAMDLHNNRMGREIYHAWVSGTYPSIEAGIEAYHNNGWLILYPAGP